MSSSGPNSTGTVTDDATVGTVTWSNPSNATTDDSNYATAALNDSACFLAGTVISTPFGDKNIESVVAGDFVYAHDGSIVSVAETVHVDNYAYIHIVTDSSSVNVTHDHPFLSNGFWVEAGLLKVGMTVSTISGDETIQSWKCHFADPEADCIDESSQPISVYNLKIGEEPHTFVANGYLVHNK